MRKKSQAKTGRRNPVAKAVKKLPPKVVPDRRRKKLKQARDRETEEETKR